MVYSMENPKLKWVIYTGTPIFGHLHMIVIYDMLGYIHHSGTMEGWIYLYDAKKSWRFNVIRFPRLLDTHFPNNVGSQPWDGHPLHGGICCDDYTPWILYHIPSYTIYPLVISPSYGIHGPFIYSINYIDDLCWLTIELLNMVIFQFAMSQITKV